MSILFFRSLPIVAFTVLAMLNISNLGAMNSSIDLEPMDIEEEFLTLDDLETTPELQFQVQTLFDFAREYLVPYEVSRMILDDFTQLWIAKLSQYLKANSQTPEEILKLIKQLLKDYQFDVSVNVLRLAFQSANMVIGDIMDVDDRTCLHVACNDIQYQECTKVLLCVAGDKAWDLMAMKSFAGWSAWHEAVSNSDENSVTVFINWAIVNKKEKDLFYLETCANEIALQIAASNNRLEAFERLFNVARGLGIEQESLMMIDGLGNTALDYTKKRPKIFKIIKSHGKK